MISKRPRSRILLATSQTDKSVWTAIAGMKLEVCSF